MRADDAAGDLADALVRWAADARADEAGRARSRARWLRHQAEEEATFAGLLVDLAEQGTAVLLRTTAGRRHRGAVAAVGADFVLLEPDGGAAARRWVLVPLDAVTTVRPAHENRRTGPAQGARAPTLDLLLAEALDAMAAADGPRTTVTIVLEADPDPVAGELEAIGADVLTVRVDGSPQTRTFVRLGAVTEVVVGA